MQQSGEAFSEPSRNLDSKAMPQTGMTDPADVNDVNNYHSLAGIGANSPWQIPVDADRHNNFTINKSDTAQSPSGSLIGGANFILADGHAKFLKVSPENGGKGGGVSVGYPSGDPYGNCVSPDNLGGTGFVATFCRQ